MDTLWIKNGGGKVGYGWSRIGRSWSLLTLGYGCTRLAHGSVLIFYIDSYQMKDLLKSLIGNMHNFSTVGVRAYEYTKSRGTTFLSKLIKISLAKTLQNFTDLDSWNVFISLSYQQQQSVFINRLSGCRPCHYLEFLFA